MNAYVSVERIKSLAKKFFSPPLLLQYSAKPVQQCQPTDPLGCCVKKMYDGVFSQLPVYDGNNYFGLLTSETIAAQVMKHQADDENYKFMPAKATIPEALAAFEDFQRRGKRLEAILITN